MPRGLRLRRLAGLGMEVLDKIPVAGILAGAGILVLVVGLWVLLERAVNPTSARIAEPDAEARLTGRCGDTMEVRLKIRNGMVAGASYWADGCGPSSACAAAATKLALGKAVDDVPEAATPEAIEKAIGGLPEDQRHCAALASETLIEAVHAYWRLGKGVPPSLPPLKPVS